jgi:DNA-binding transcriptional MerR regulator
MASRITALKRARPASRPRRQAQTSYLSRDALRTLGGITDDQLRLWEFEELITHSTLLEVEGHRVPVYNQATLRRIRTIRSLGEELGVNLPGIGVILHLLDQLSAR